VERKGVDENGEEVEFEWTGDVQPEGGKEDSELMLERGLEDERKSKRERSSSAREEFGGGDGSGDGLERMKEKIQNMSAEEFRKFLEEQAKEILDIAVDRTLDKVAEKVMENKEGDHSMFDTEDEEEGAASSIKIMKEKGEEGKKKEAREKAFIKELKLTPTRSSPRLANSGDEHTMDKVEKRAAQRNLESMDGNVLNNPLFSPSNAHVLFSVKQLGIRVSDVDDKDLEFFIDSCSVPKDQHFVHNSLDDIEEDLMWNESEEDSVEILENLAIKELCGDLLEEVFDDDSYHLSGDTKVASKRYKSRAKSRKRKACKVASAKLTKLVSK
jgi:hypothetical protein